MNSTLGGRRGPHRCGHAGVDSSVVRPITPGKSRPAVLDDRHPGPPASRRYRPPLAPYPALRWRSPHHPVRMTRVKKKKKKKKKKGGGGGGGGRGRDGGEFTLIALSVDLVAVLAAR